MNIQAIADKLIAYGASAAAILGAVHNELGGSHDKVSIYVAAAIAFIHHMKPILETIKATVPPIPPSK